MTRRGRRCMQSISMFSKLLLVSLSLLARLVATEDVSFTYNGFRSSNLSLDGVAEISSDGLLTFTKNYIQRQAGHAFYPNPVTFKNSSNGTTFSFSTTFIVAIGSEYSSLGDHGIAFGIAFVIAPTRGLPGALPSQYLGLFNESNIGNASNHVVAIELDTVQDIEFEDINDNHVGIDINGLISEKSASAGYYADDSGAFRNLNLEDRQQLQVWVEYDGVKKQINVTLAPINLSKPKTPLLSFSRDLSPIIKEIMYVGFSASNGLIAGTNYVLAWSFKMNGQAQDFQLPKLPPALVEGPPVEGKERSSFLTIGLPVIIVSLVLIAISGLVYVIRRKRKFAELVEEWELDYGPHRFKYKDLYIATKGFKDKELLGRGGFGKVYRGVLPSSEIQIAVKKVSNESKQGMREFVAEIVTIGQLRHRNIVQLLGYCRRKGELLLVYDYMPNGSLDKYLYNQPKVTLNWSKRFRVIKGVASGLFYLHEEWEQVVIHRDVKASNVLLDDEFNGRLGDFGLARLYHHGTDPQTTHAAGTFGYLAPEHTRTGKATTRTDVFAFGAFLLEVASGRRPINSRGPAEEVILVDWVFSYWNRGQILEARDPNLGTDYVAEEVELVMKLGLLCSHLEPSHRPMMRQIVRYLERDAPLPELSSLGLSASGLTFAQREGFSGFVMDNASLHLSSVAESILSGGR